MSFDRSVVQLAVAKSRELIGRAFDVLGIVARGCDRRPGPTQFHESFLFRFDQTRLSQPYAWPSTVFVDELDAGRFKGALYDIQCGSTRLTYSAFQLVDCNSPNSGVLGQILLAPPN